MIYVQASVPAGRNAHFFFKYTIEIQQTVIPHRSGNITDFHFCGGQQEARPGDFCLLKDANKGKPRAFKNQLAEMLR